MEHPLSNDERSGSAESNAALHWVYYLWIAFAVALCVRTLVFTRNHSVYPVYVAGTNQWWADKPLHAFIPEVCEIYRYSPTFAILFTPLAKLPLGLGGTLWGLLTVGALFAARSAMIRDLLPYEWSSRQMAGFLGLALTGSAVGIWAGQSNSLLVALVIFACAGIVHRRWWTAAALLGLAVFIKLWPLAVVLLLASCWPKQLSWRFAIVALALALVPFLTRPPSTVVWQYRQWWNSLTGPQQNRWGGFRDAWTIWEIFLAAGLEDRLSRFTTRHGRDGVGVVFVAAAPDRKALPLPDHCVAPGEGRGEGRGKGRRLFPRLAAVDLGLVAVVVRARHRAIDLWHHRPLGRLGGDGKFYGKKWPYQDACHEPDSRSARVRRRG